MASKPPITVIYLSLLLSLLHATAAMDCPSGSNCSICDTTTGQCLACPRGKGFSKGKCKTLNVPEHCMYFENPHNVLLESTKCEICENGYYLKWGGTVCEPESNVAACHSSCYACKETAEDSMTDNPNGSECQLCKTDYFWDSSSLVSCHASNNSTGWWHCNHEGTRAGECLECQESRVEYFGQKRCDLAFTTTDKLNPVVKYCEKYADAQGTTCSKCQAGYGMVNEKKCRSFFRTGVVWFCIGLTALLVAINL